MNVIAELQKYDFPTDEYVVFGGAVMAARGLKETRDIDVLVSHALLERLREDEVWKHHPRIIPTEEPGLVNASGTVELYPTIGGIADMTFQRLRENAEIIEGIPFASLPDIRAIKEVYDREKDRAYYTHRCVSHL